MTYRWLPDKESTRQLREMPRGALGDYFRVREALEDDPRSRWLGATPYADPAHPDTWYVIFGSAGLLAYRINDERRELMVAKLVPPVVED